jgi:Tfp pilus assembly protein PilF
MIGDSQRRVRSKKKVILFFWLWTLMLMLVAACGARPKTQEPARHTQANRLASQGSYWFRKGCSERAERYFYKALESSRLLDDLEGMVRARNNLGAVALAQRHYLEAGEHLQKALELNSVLKSAREQSLTLGNLGSLAYKAERYREAEEFWEKALVAAEGDVEQTGMAMHLNNLGMLRLHQGRLTEAELLLQRAMTKAEEGAAGSTLANTHVQLGRLAQARGDLAGAEAHLSLALEIDKAAENTVGIAHDLELLGILHQQQKLWNQAALELDRAIHLYATLGKTEKALQLYDHLVALQAHSGVPESLEPYEALLVPPDEFWRSPLCQ